MEDDPPTRDVVSLLLEEEGYDVVGCESVEGARDLIGSRAIELAVVDLRLGRQNGLQVVRQCVGQGIPVLILSGKSDPVDKVVGLEIGADDYVTKPFDHREFVARVRRLMSRAAARAPAAAGNGAPAEAGRPPPPPAEPCRIGGWTLHPERRCAQADDGTLAPLSDAEFRTLLCLAERRGRVVSRDELFRCVVGPMERDPLDRRIDTYVSGLRRKLNLPAGEEIRTIHRVGYIID